MGLREHTWKDALRDVFGRLLPDKRDRTIALLVVAVVVGGMSLQMLARSLRGAAGRGDDATTAGSGGDAPSPLDRDLLAAHGSFGGDTAVPMVFARPAAAAAPAPAVEPQPAAEAAPAVEPAPTAAQPWVGQAPPALLVRVVVVGASARRAVLDGRVVAVGDEVAGGIVAAIERDALVLYWSGRRLTYDLGVERPREYRAELARRAQAAPAESNERENR